MEIIPALDIREGSCVQLVGGDVSKETIRKDNPQAQAEDFISQGAKRLDIVDLEVIASGGIRSREDIEDLANAEVDGVILGTAAYTGQLALKELFDSTE